MTKPTVAHSPLPWTVKKCDCNRGWCNQYYMDVNDLDFSFCKADAQLIARRVNSGDKADELVELILNESPFTNLKVAKILKAAGQYQKMQEEPKP